MSSLAEKYPDEVKAILAKYPPEHKRSAVMPLLYLAQRDGGGYITKAAMEDVAHIVGISVSDVAAVVGFYSLYHDKPAGKYRIQVCTDVACALRGADKFVEELCNNLGIKIGETTPDGLVTVEEVKCLAACNHAPVFQVQTPDGLTYHQDMDIKAALDLIEQWRKETRNDKA